MEKQAILSFKRDRQSLEQKHMSKDLTHQPKIDSTSAEIVQNSELGGVAVLDRLFLHE